MKQYASTQSKGLLALQPKRIASGDLFPINCWAGKVFVLCLSRFTWHGR